MTRRNQFAPVYWQALKVASLYKYFTSAGQLSEECNIKWYSRKIRLFHLARSSNDLTG
jgi:hypothetical protein